MGDECRGGAFAFGSSDADSLAGVALQEEVGLRGDVLRIDVGQQARHGDARRLDHPVESISLLQKFHHLLVVVGDDHRTVGIMLLQETMGALSLATVSGEEDC